MVTVFGYLEYTLASTCYALLTTGEIAKALLDTSDDHPFFKWFSRNERSQVDNLHGLILEFERVIRESSQVPHNVREDLVERLKELKPKRNALRHVVWLSIDDNGLAHLQHNHLDESIPIALQPNLPVKDLSVIRGQTVDSIFQIAEVASIADSDNTYVAGPGFILATVMPRQYEPRNTPTERE